MDDYNKFLINVNSPLARPVTAQDALTFDNRLYDTGIDQLAPNTVGTSQIQDGAVTQNKVAANSVTGSNVIDGGLGSADLASDNIHGSHLSGSAVAGTHISLNAVTNNKINDYDLAKGTGLSMNVTNVGTFGTVRANAELSANGTAGFSGAIDLATTGTINVDYGLITGTS